MNKKSTMRRSSRIASIYGTEWSNQPSIQSLRKQATKAILHDWVERPVSFKIHHVSIPTRGVCTITDDQLRDNTKQIQTLLNQVSFKDTALDRAREIISLYQYLYTHPCILFLNPRLMDVVVRKITEFTTEIANKENQLQEYFDAANRMSAALSYSQREIGNSILELGMKQKVEERNVWYDLRTVLMDLSEILPITKLVEPVAVSPRAKIDRDPSKYFTHGQRIRHQCRNSDGGSDTRIGTYDSLTKGVRCGDKIQTLNQFAKHHYLEVRPDRVSNVNAWDECECEVEGKWVSIQPLKKIENDGTQ
jgi:hypothetical protein